MNHHTSLRHIVRFGVLAIALDSFVIASPAFADEAPAKPASKDAGPGDKGTGATITIDKLELQLVADKPGDKANDPAPPQIMINGKVVGPEEAEKIIKSAIKDKEKKQESAGRVIRDIKVGPPNEGNLIIVGEAKEGKGTPAEGQGKFIINLTAKISDHFLGLECFPADEALRAQLSLPEHQGLIVEQVVPDSPAAKAGIKRFDVLLWANDKKLGEVSDLTGLVDEAKEISLKLLRGGKQKAISVTPAKRPKPEADVLKAVPAPPDPKALEEGMKFLMKSPGGDGKGNVQFRVVGPAVAVPPLARFTELPDDMRVTVTWEGKKLPQILVKQGDKKWEITDLDEQPEKIQGFVGPLIGRYDLLRFRAPGEGGTWERPVVKPFPGPGTDAAAAPATKKPGDEKRPDGAIEKRMEMMQRQIDELREMSARLPVDIKQAMAGMAKQIEELRGEARAGIDKRREEFREREQQIRQEYEQKLRELKKAIGAGKSEGQDKEPTK